MTGAGGGRRWVGGALSLTRPVLGGALRSLSCWVPTPTKAPALAGITSLSWEMWEGARHGEGLGRTNADVELLGPRHLYPS